jgi:hypothetical protein
MVADIPGLLDMVELPEGTFWMGLAEDDAQAYDTVSGFAIGRVVVTCRLYREVMTEDTAAVYLNTRGSPHVIRSRARRFAGSNTRTATAQRLR